MPEDIYEVVALGARWWFILLGVLIVLRSFRWLRRDGKRAKRRLRQLPDAGMVGEMVVVTGSRHLHEGLTMSVPREGMLGSYRSCDLVIPADDVAPVHCDFSFADGEGLLLIPRRNCAVKIDGEEILSRRTGKKHPMTHGSRLQVGEAVLRLRLFEGIEARTPQHTRNDAWRDDVEEALEATDDVYRQSPMAWTDTPDSAPYQPYPQPGPSAPYQAGPYQPPYQHRPYQPEPYQAEPYQHQPYQPPYQAEPYQHQPDQYGGSEYQPSVSPDAQMHPRVRRYRSGRRRSDEEA